MESEKQQNPGFRQIVPAWAIGRYAFGLIRGLFKGLSLTDSIGIAGHSFLAGALAGAIGGAVGGLVVTYLSPATAQK